MKNAILYILSIIFIAAICTSCKYDVRKDFLKEDFIDSIQYGPDLCQEFYRNRFTTDDNVKVIRGFAKSFLSFNKLTDAHFKRGVRCPGENILVVVESRHNGKNFSPGTDPHARGAMGSYDSISWYYKGGKYRSVAQVKRQVKRIKYGYTHRFYH